MFAFCQKQKPAMGFEMNKDNEMKQQVCSG